LEAKISSTNKRIDQLDSLPDEIRKVIETTNNQHAILLRNVYREIADNLAKQQQSLDESCKKAVDHVQQLNKKHEEAEQIYSQILSISNSLSMFKSNISDSLSEYKSEIESLNKKTAWLFVLVSLSLLLIVFGFII
jgi:archaellum component FlaC